MQWKSLAEMYRPDRYTEENVHFDCMSINIRAGRQCQRPTSDTAHQDVVRNRPAGTHTYTPSSGSGKAATPSYQLLFIVASLWCPFSLSPWH